MLDRIFTILLIFVPATLAAKYLHFSPLVLFFLSALAIVPLAKLLGDGTEALAAHTSPALGGILNATFGNATELIISLFALRAGLTELVKASITGSIIGNLLLVLGVAIFAGGLKYKIQEFNKTMARASASTLLLAVIALIIPAIFLQTAPKIGDRIIEELSIFVAIFMLIVYCAGLLFTLHTHKHLGINEAEPSAGHRLEYAQKPPHSLVVYFGGCLDERDLGGIDRTDYQTSRLDGTLYRGNRGSHHRECRGAFLRGDDGRQK